MFLSLLALEANLWWTMGAPSALGVGMSLLGQSWWRRLLIGMGFPMSVSLVAGLTLPPWGWCVPLAALLLIYPLNAWRDAPIFPTPPDALNALPECAPLHPGARILDAGCGLGHGLRALRQAYPLNQLVGVEKSRLLALWCARRCPWANVVHGDMWASSWADYALVYLFQRPESMSQALSKASLEMKAGTYLVSLEFEAVGYEPLAQIRHVEVSLSPEGKERTVAEGKSVWVYQMPLTYRAQPQPIMSNSIVNTKPLQET
jgi:hypothetical protein